MIKVGPWTLYWPGEKRLRTKLSAQQEANRAQYADFADLRSRLQEEMWTLRRHGYQKATGAYPEISPSHVMRWNECYSGGIGACLDLDAKVTIADGPFPYELAGIGRVEWRGLVWIVTRITSERAGIRDRGPDTRVFRGEMTLSLSAYADPTSKGPFR